jgi:hypothetical protein
VHMQTKAKNSAPPNTAARPYRPARSFLDFGMTEIRPRQPLLVSACSRRLAVIGEA